MKGDALQTFKNINGPTRENLGEILAVFRRKYVNPQSMATAKHKFQKLVFNPANQRLVDFLDELRKLAKDAFGLAAHAIIEQFIYAKVPPHLKKSINQAHLERVTKRLSKEFSRTENRILGALARLDDFFMNPLLQGHSGTTPESSRNALSINQGTNEDDSQNDPHPEAGLLHGQMTQNSGPEDGHDAYTILLDSH